MPPDTAWILAAGWIIGCGVLTLRKSPFDMLEIRALLEEIRRGLARKGEKQDLP